jgi:hypothetical protein
MNATSTRPNGPSPFAIDVPADLRGLESLGHLASFGKVGFDARRGKHDLWIVASVDGHEIAALRSGHGGDELSTVVTRTESGDESVFEFASNLGALRTKVSFPSQGRPVMRCTTSLLPGHDVAIPFWPRDLCVHGSAGGTVHTAQRGLRSGIVYASAESPIPFTLFYFQDFSSSTEYFETLRRSPAGTVGGTWPELGYAPPGGDDGVLPRSREFIISDAYLTVDAGAPANDAEIAGTYLDRLTETYLALPRPDPEYHDWPQRAERTLHDLDVSPAATYARRGRRYVMPYVADETKPPESMVQLTLAVNADEYRRWRGGECQLAEALQSTVPAFFDEEVGSLVRWLPGDRFEPSQAEENMNHDAMDSWYLHHALFNLSRLASAGDTEARELFARSLPFVMRAARRFDYEWPIFFGLRTLDVIRAESEPGKGGEHDVGGLYALVMLHAHELFADPEYLAEAERAVLHLRGLGFRLGYQMNTTGFAAEAAMRLWKITQDRAFLELSEICMANLFDNMWLWRCDYGHAKHYRTFFGLFPLRDAPYLAAYEELEALAKFHEYLSLGGHDVRPSLRLLLAEYQKYSLDRGWYYYPDALPRDVVAEKARNGRVERALAVPLEDLHDGWEPSGQVGQELYGAGIAFVYVARHYMAMPETGCLVYCDYPMYDFALDDDGRGASWRAGGDPRGTCELRVIPDGANVPPVTVGATTRAGAVTVPLRGKHTVEGHARFPLRGGQTVQLRFAAPEDAQKPGIEIGGVRRTARQPA